MATLSSDKAVARTVSTINERAYLSTQLVRLSKGKSIEKNEEKDFTVFFKTVQALSKYDSKISYFYNSMALLIKDERFPLFIDQSIIGDLYAIWKQYATVSEFEKLRLQLAYRSKDDNAANFYLYDLLVDYRKCFVCTPQMHDWIGIFKLLIADSHGIDFRIRFWLKYSHRFGFGQLESIETLMSCKKRTLQAMEYLLGKYQRMSAEKIDIAFDCLRGSEKFRGERNMWRELGCFLNDAFPFLVAKLGGEFISNCHYELQYYFNLWQSSKQWNLSISFYDVLRFIPTFALVRFPSNQDVLAHLGKGQNIRTLFPNLTKSAAHHFHNYEGTATSLSSILMECIFNTFDGSASICEIVCQHINENHFLVISDRFKLWINLLMKCSDWEKENELEMEEWTRLVGFVFHIVQDVPDFKVKGRTFQSFQRLSTAYYAEQQWTRFNRYSFTALEWKGKPYKDFNLEVNGSVYQIIQLKTSKGLALESSTMHHCVHSYVPKAAKGQCSIWSLRLQMKDNNWLSLVTIEVNANNSIVQAKGKYNKQPETAQLEMIKEWANANKVSFLRC